MKHAELVNELLQGSFWHNWMAALQRKVIANILATSEEGDFYAERLGEIRKRIEAMPQTGQSDGVAYIRYFGGPVTIHLTEKDRGETEAGWQPHEPQIQASGLIEILPNYPEYGYVNLEEIMRGFPGLEMDLHFNPTLVDDTRIEP